MKRLLALSCASMVVLGTIARAAEGRIPLLALPGPPFFITQPGYYLLTSDTGLTTNTVVTIQSDGVTLDLGGNTITGPTSYVAPTISVQVTSGTREITIKNGRTFAGSHGVLASRGTRIHIAGLDISGSLGGVSVSAEQAEVLDCRIHDLATTSGFGRTAIAVEAFGGRILDNRIQNVPGAGIHALGFRAGEIRRNIVRNFGAVAPLFGILLEDISFDPGNTGGAVIADNVVSSLPSGVDDDGIYVYAANNLIMGNVASYNGRFGIFVSGAQNRLERNIANLNGDDGIGFSLVPQRNHLEANQAQGNTGCGLNLNATIGTVYRDNTLGGNTGGNVCGGPGINAGGNYCDLALCP